MSSGAGGRDNGGAGRANFLFENTIGEKLAGSAYDCTAPSGETKRYVAGSFALNPYVSVDYAVCPVRAPSFRGVRFGRIVCGMSEAETAAKWTERVRSWRASGASAVSFAAGQGFAASTLRWWDSKLTQAAKPRVAMARVVRGTGGPAEAGAGAATSGVAPPSAPTLTLEVDGVRIVVRRGFDAELLRQLVHAVGGAR